MCMNRWHEWWENFKEWIKVPRHRGLFSLLLISAAIPVVVAATFISTENRQHASDASISDTVAVLNLYTHDTNHSLDSLQADLQDVLTGLTPYQNSPQISKIPPNVNVNVNQITSIPVNPENIKIKLPSPSPIYNNSKNVQGATTVDYRNRALFIAKITSMISSIDGDTNSINNKLTTVESLWKKTQYYANNTTDSQNIMKIISDSRTRLLSIPKILHLIINGYSTGSTILSTNEITDIKNILSGTVTTVTPLQTSAQQIGNILVSLNSTNPPAHQPKIDRVDPVDINNPHTEQQAEPLIDAEEPKKSDDYQTDGYNWPKVYAARTWCDSNKNVFINFTWNPGYEEGNARNKYTLVYYIDGIGDTYSPLPANTTSATFNIGNVQNKYGVVKVGNGFSEYGYKHTVFTTATCTPPTPTSNNPTPTISPMQEATPTLAPTPGNTETQSVCITPTVTITPLCYGNISYFNFSFSGQVNTTYSLTYTQKDNSSNTKTITGSGKNGIIDVQGPIDGVGVPYESQWNASLTTSCSQQVTVSQVVTARKCP